LVFSVFNICPSINAMTMDSEGFDDDNDDDDDDDSALLYAFLAGGMGMMVYGLGAVMSMAAEPTNGLRGDR
jgi:ankyrin repeat protein